jgi:phage terminase small subunit
MPNVRRKKNGLGQARQQREAALAAAQPQEKQGYNVLTPGSEPPALAELKGKAYDYWRYMVDEAPEGHFAVTDAPMLANYCRLLARCDVFTERMHTEGLTIDTEYGERINPYWSGYMKMVALMAQINARLRLAPGSRQATIVANDPDRKNKRNTEKPSRKQAPSRTHLLFGGARVAAQVAAEDGDDSDD